MFRNTNQSVLIKAWHGTYKQGRQVRDLLNTQDGPRGH